MRLFSLEAWWIVRQLLLTFYVPLHSTMTVREKDRGNEKRPTQEATLGDTNVLDRILEY